MLCDRCNGEYAVINAETYDDEGKKILTLKCMFCGNLNAVLEEEYVGHYSIQERDITTHTPMESRQALFKAINTAIVTHKARLSNFEIVGIIEVAKLGYVATVENEPYDDTLMEEILREANKDD